ncbi:uracil phosphoribosyltransferase [Vibrio sp. Of7-15]|uniref:uracil phosphoribosyltransferase n=1 Tax=Vibrio sp. Of7-15 TaxID=2724879 RepID=UPI001EF1CB12|nr:uracil phosphoribosyltransferase [Vibrio sp. Of7-15]MCG7495496.1 uracil phosphoribosyltransferase [Vibrio sp. Of7-15]
MSNMSHSNLGSTQPPSLADMVLPDNVHCFQKEIPHTSTPVIHERYERLEQLRDRERPYTHFRHSADKLFELIADDMAPNWSNREVILAPIFRAGLSLLPVFMARIEQSRLCSIGVKRNEATAQPEPYLFKVPREYAADAKLIILEPMIATAGTMCYSLKMLQQHGFDLKQVEIVSIFAALEGVQKVHGAYPEVTINVEVVDPILDDQKYIVPGCGDFGDRYFGT